MEPVVSVLLWPIMIAIMCAGAVVSGLCMLCWGLWQRRNQSAPRNQGTQTVARATRSIATCTTVTTNGADGGKKKKGEDDGHGQEDSVSRLRKMQKRIEALERRSLRDVASSDTESPRHRHNSPAQTWRRKQRDRNDSSSRERGDRRGRRH